MSSGFFTGPGAIHHHDQTKQSAITALRESQGFFLVTTRYDKDDDKYTNTVVVSGENLFLSGASTLVAIEQASEVIERMRENVQSMLEDGDT